MLLLICVVLGVAIGLACKGRLALLARLRGLIFPILALGFFAATRFLPGQSVALRGVLTTLYYACCLGFAFLNGRHFLAGAFIALGTLSNYLVIAANGFRMPISSYALSYYPDITAQSVTEKNAGYFIENGDAKLLILGDVICIPLPGIGGFISVGDVLLAMGVMVLIIYAMAPKQLSRPKQKHIPKH